MMRLAMILLLVIAGCTSTSKVAYQDTSGVSIESGDVVRDASLDSIEARNTEHDQFLNELDSVNTKMRADFFRKFSRNLSSVSSEVYLTQLGSYQSDVARRLKQKLENFDVISVSGFRRTFVMCGYSKKSSLSVCDDPMCTSVEKVSFERENKISELKVGLPLERCD